MRQRNHVRRVVATLWLAVLALVCAAAPAAVYAAPDEGLVVDDTVTDASLDHFFTYTDATDPQGLTGWAADTKASINGSAEAKTQHWVWNRDWNEAKKHTYTFTFTGTGVELVGVKNDATNAFQLDGGDVETVTITGAANTPTTLYKKEGLEYGRHTVAVTLPEGGTGLQVSFARVFGAEQASVIRVACVGDSLTEGYQSSGGLKGSTAYPAQLQELLGSGYEVKNFGKTSMTLMKGTNKSYWDTKEYRDSMAYEPNIVVIMLGTNDSKDAYWNEERYLADARALVKGYEELSSAPQVFFAYAPRSFATGSTSDIRTEMIDERLHPAQVKLAEEEGWKVIDLYKATTDREDLYHPDLLHFTDEGYRFLAERVAAALTPSGLAGGIVDTDTQYTQDRYAEVVALTSTSTTLSAWKNDKATSEIALAAVGTDLKGVTVSASDLTGKSGTISKDQVTTTFITSTKAYNGGYLGYGSTTRPVPADNGSNRSESNDILMQTTPMDVGDGRVQPVWVEFAIPADAAAGTYTGTITVTAEGIETPLELSYTVEVADATLADVSEFESNFDIELWQYPYTSAEYYGVEPFSPEHLEIMRSGMEIYKELGGHAITTTISEDAWAGQTYSANEVHYPSMVKWIKNGDGSFSYDFSDFDAWVSFCKSLGIGDKIVLYSIAPWHNSFTYWDGDKLVRESYKVGSDRYNAVWTDFLRAMVDHLMEKGWFDDAYVGIDERGFSKAAFDLIDSVRNIHDVPLKTAGAMDGFVDKPDLALRVTDLNVGDTAAAKHAKEFTQLVADRAAKGYRTTLYSCTEHQPGNFSLSAPVESYWSVVNAGEQTSGFLRWAYDAWVADPLRDATHNAFEPGDPFLIYPDEKDAARPVSKSSVRLERMAEGVRDVNKIKQMVAEIPSLKADADALYDRITTTATTGRSYLSKEKVVKLSGEMASFKQGLDDLTKRYIELKENGTDQVESVSIDGGDQSIQVGETLQLQATVKPDNVLDASVAWASSNADIAEVSAAGVVTAKQAGTVSITATSNLDTSKSTTVAITVKPLAVAPGISSYSFDNKTVEDGWGDRDGILKDGASFDTQGRSGAALKVVDGAGATLPGDSGLGENSAWTVSYWARVDRDFTDRIAAMTSADDAFSADFKMAADRASGFRVGKRPGDVLTFAYNFARDTWYHVTWTQSKDAGLSMYVNGVKVETNSWTKTNRVLAPADVIGGPGFTGLIDEVKIYDRVLTDAEVVANMLVKGLNIPEMSKTIFVGDTYVISTNLVSDEQDKTITFTSSDPSVATVDENGTVTGVARGTAEIVVENRAGGFKDIVTITVKKRLTISNTLSKYLLNQEKYVTDVHKETEDTSNQYFGQPDMVRTSTGRLITAFPQGHGKGPLIMKVSDDNGTTWTQKTDIPKSWAGSQETPTMYVLKLDGGKERIMLITACPGWGTDSDGNRYGWNTSYSDDNGETWTEYKHWYSQRPDGANNDVIVGMASLVQLKDEQGNDIQKWMGVYHTYGYVNYRTYLTFDENGNEQWSEPEAYLSEYRDIESRYQMCEIGMFRSPDGKRIVGLARSQSHNNPATLIYSDDEGKTWSEPMDLPGSLAGERHKATYDPVSGRLVITFREIKYDLNGNNQFDGNADWTCGEWVAWVGTYDQLMNQEDGEYMIVLAEDWANNAKSGDTGYAGVVVLEDGTFIMDSYGHWDKDFSMSWPGGVTTDRCYIKQAKFKLGEVENDNGLVDRSELEAAAAEAGKLAEADYTSETWAPFAEALAAASAGLEDVTLQQVQVDALVSDLLAAQGGLKPVSPQPDPDPDPTPDPDPDPTPDPDPSPSPDPDPAPSPDPDPAPDPTPSPGTGGSSGSSGGASSSTLPSTGDPSTFALLAVGTAAAVTLGAGVIARRRSKR